MFHIGLTMKKVLLAFVFVVSMTFMASAVDSPEATTYQIRNVKYSELLRPRDANNAIGTPIVLYPAQPWKCMTWRLEPTGKSAFQMKNLFTSKTISAGANTNAAQRFVAQVPLVRDAGGSPSWQFTQLADGNYKITEPNSGQALTAIKTEGGSEVKVVVVPWQNQAEQKWILEKIDPKDLTM